MCLGGKFMWREGFGAVEEASSERLVKHRDVETQIGTRPPQRAGNVATNMDQIWIKANEMLAGIKRRRGRGRDLRHGAFGNRSKFYQFPKHGAHVCLHSNPAVLAISSLLLIVLGLRYASSTLAPALSMQVNLGVGSVLCLPVVLVPRGQKFATYLREGS